MNALLRAIVLTLLVVACGTVPIDDQGDDKRVIPPKGLIRGTVTYIGPRPCSRDGHIVGNAVITVFDKNNPPPPAGFASGAVNFVAVPGDVLFTNEPRSTGSDLYCPGGAAVTASAPFTVAPMEAGSYVIRAFYDRGGRFWPTFKSRNLPEAGDIAGGYVDVEDARKNAGNISYQPIFLPVDVGLARSAEDGRLDIGDNGYVADNIPVTIGSQLPFTRPYFYPDGAEKRPDAATTPANPRGDPLAVPIVTMTQDHQLLAFPANVTPETVTAFQRSFVSTVLKWGVPAAELDAATDPTKPFGLQIAPAPPTGKGGIYVFSRGGPLPDNPLVAALWPQAGFAKLIDDPNRRVDPQGLVVQGSRGQAPLVVVQGITLFDDSLLRSTVAAVPRAPTVSALKDHVTVLARPAVLCLDPRDVAKGGVLVTPHFTARSADASEVGDKPLFDPQALAKQPGVREVKKGCLPLGRYSISLVYSTGQAWTVPNEMGSCGALEGGVALSQGTSSAGTCTNKARPVLLSQGTRAVLEIVPPSTTEGAAYCRSLDSEERPEGERGVPVECLKLEP